MEPRGEGKGRTGNTIPHKTEEDFKMTRQGKPKARVLCCRVVTLNSHRLQSEAEPREDKEPRGGPQDDKEPRSEPRDEGNGSTFD